MNLIEVNNLRFSYTKGAYAVDGVSFVVEEGKYISIIGHNGSGKSTISRLLMGLLEANEGEIIEFGKPLNKDTCRELRHRIGIVFQNPDNQFIGSTVRDDIAFGLENRRVPQSEMDSIIDKYSTKVNMKEFLDKEPENLSGGQKQRVAIAGVLAMNPELVIFDEATSMLDPKGKKEIAECIKMMRKENPRLSIISITHNIEEAFESDEIIALSHGKIVLQGKPEEFRNNEKVLKEIGLELPFKDNFAKKLKENGINVNPNESIEGMVKKICR